MARAIEDLIDSGLLSREAALILLKEIRMSTDELQETYAKYDVSSARYNTREEVSFISNDRVDLFFHILTLLTNVFRRLVQRHQADRQEHHQLCLLLY